MLTLLLVLLKNILLSSCDDTFTNPCSSPVSSNILILFAVKLSITLISFPFKTLLFLYIIFLVLYLTYFTRMGWGLASIDFFGFPSLYDLSISSGLIFLIHMLFFYFRDNSSVSLPSASSTSWIKRTLHLEYCSCMSNTASISSSPFVRLLFSFLKLFISLLLFFISFSNSKHFSLIHIIAEFTSLSCSLPLIYHSLSARDISFTFFISVYKLGNS